MTVLQLLVGLVFLLGGGEALVKGSVAVARRLGVSSLVIGLTIVSFGTSSPELMTSIQAALIGSPGIAIGNVVGSNIANTLLILGISALILPLSTTRRAFWREGLVLIGASLLMLAVVLSGSIERWTGVVFLALLVGYTLFVYYAERLKAAEPAAGAGPVPEKDAGTRLLPSVVLALCGVAAVVFGADLLVDSAVAIARTAGLSEAVIGLTLVAVGTSLPELATSAMAAFRRQGDIAFGNIVGSNILNILGIVGACAIVTPIQVPTEIAEFDIWAMLGTAFLLVLFAGTGWRINRWEGGLLLLAYGGYLAVQFMPQIRTLPGLAAL